MLVIFDTIFNEVEGIYNRSFVTYATYIYSAVTKVTGDRTWKSKICNYVNMSLLQH
jgi:hypothetical protein